MKHDLLEYAATHATNREIFLLNYGKDFGVFNCQLGALLDVWSRIGAVKDLRDRSHAGLLLFVNILIRHAMFGFQHIVTYQSIVAWYTFRPGLEALLVLGKFVDNPANAKIWRDRLVDRTSYQKTFSGKSLISKSLPRSSDFRDVLTCLNDDFMHPNPYFTYKDMSIRGSGQKLSLEIQYFDVVSDVHEGHLLAYLNLIDLILWASESLVDNLYGPPPDASNGRNTFSEAEASRASDLAIRNPTARKVMEELGLWRFKSVA